MGIIIIIQMESLAIQMEIESWNHGIIIAEKYH